MEIWFDEASLARFGGPILIVAVVALVVAVLTVIALFGLCKDVKAQ